MLLKWCESCVWAQDCGGKTFCPWGAGMCVKVRGSFTDPDEFKLHKKILRAEYGIEPTEKEREKKK